MNLKDLGPRIQTFQERIAELRERMSASGGPEEADLALDVVQEVDLALDELQAVEAELEEQHEELIATRAALQEERRRYSELFESAPDGYLVTDASGSIQDANRAACVLLDIERPFLVGKPLLAFVPIADRRAFRAQLAERRRVDRTEEWLAYLQPRSGAVVRVSLTVAAVRSHEGEVQSFRWLVRDISRRWQMEEAVSLTAQRLQLLHEIDRAVLAARSPEETASAALAGVRHIARCRRAGVWTFDFAQRRARLLAVDTAGESRLAAGTELSLAEFGACERQWQAAECTIADLGAQSQPSAYVRLLLEEGQRSLVSIPLAYDGQIFGCLDLASDGTDAFGKAPVEFARQVADSLAVAMQNARMRADEQRARRVAETLRDAHITMTQSLDLDAVVRSLLADLGKLMVYDTARVALLDRETGLLRTMTGSPDDWVPGGALADTAFDPQDLPAISALLASQQSLMVPDVLQLPATERVPAGDQVRSWLGVPLVAHGKLLGLVSLGKAEPGFFDGEQTRLVEALAAQAAIAIENAQLFEEVRTTRSQLRGLSRRLVEVQESERRYIARELHDEAGQALAALMVGLRLLANEADRPPAVLARAEQLKQAADGVLENLHRLAMDLRPASLDHLGLVAALRQYVDAFGRQNRLAVAFEAVGLGEERLAAEVETTLYRIVQEALTNVARHAQAQRVGVLVERQGGRVVAIVEDDGVGFAVGERGRGGRLGLFGMRERAEMLGGRVTVESTPGQGTTVYVEVPDGH